MRTTKQILGEVLSNGVLLYNGAALEKIKAQVDAWQKNVVSGHDRNHWAKTPQTILGSQIPRNLVYTPLDNAGLSFDDIGLPGVEPFTRGLHANMYRGRPFTKRQLFGAGTPSQVNRRMRMLLDAGGTGTNWTLDLATIQMFDSDEPEAKGQVANVGVSIDCVDDMEVLCNGISLDQISASIVTHYPRNTSIIFPMYLVMAERRGVPWDRLIGSVQNDFVMESLVRVGPEFIPPIDDFRVQCDNYEFIRKNVPLWNCVTLNGYNLREWGTDGITEIAVAMTNAMAILDEMIERHHDTDWTAARLAFFWSIANDFFEEVARLRAARRLWYRIMKYKYGAQNPRSMWMRCHAQTSGVSLTREEPMNNVVRAAYQALAAVLGGVQSLHVDSYDEAYSVPTEEASMLSLRTQQILEVETQVTQVVDPLGGSFYVEALTDEIERRIIDEIDAIELSGGIVQAVETGWLRRNVIQRIEREQGQIDAGQIAVVGRNYFRSNDLRMPDVKTYENVDNVEDQAREKLTMLRQKRDNELASNRLNALVLACKNGDNVMRCAVECARADVTKGEMRRAFAEGFGTWRPPDV